jgi:hypothetical protein
MSTVGKMQAERHLSSNDASHFSATAQKGMKYCSCSTIHGDSTVIIWPFLSTFFLNFAN